MTDETDAADGSPEQISEEEALRRMKSFPDRKEKFIAAIKESTDRDISTGTWPE